MCNFENDLLILLSDAARHCRTYGNHLAQEHGMTLAQLTILERLGREPDISQIEFAAITELSPMTVARVIDRLEELGLVKRCADPKDRRLWRLRLMPASAPLVREMSSLRAKLYRSATKGIDDPILEVMAHGLREMKQNVSSRLIADYA